MALTEQEAREVNQAISAWRQGDFTLGEDLAVVHMANLKRPLMPSSESAAARLLKEGRELHSRPVPVLDRSVRGLVMATQTCEIVRDCTDRQLVEMVPLVRLEPSQVREVQGLMSMRYAYVATAAGQCLVADLEQAMSVEKSALADFMRIPGWGTDEEAEAFAQALSKKKKRFAFPDDFVLAFSELRKEIRLRYGKDSAKGRQVGFLKLIMVNAKPSWDSDTVDLHWMFIVDESTDLLQTGLQESVNEWVKLFDESGRFKTSSNTACKLSDFSALDYRESKLLDFESLTYSRN